MVLKGAMRGRQALKRWRLAEERHGESPEARIALRGTQTLTYLVCNVSQSTEIIIVQDESRLGPVNRRRTGAEDTGQPDLPCARLGSRRERKGQSATRHLQRSV
jgi:hypothetical protein